MGQGLLITDIGTVATSPMAQHGPDAQRYCTTKTTWQHLKVAATSGTRCVKEVGEKYRCDLDQVTYGM